MGMFDVLKGAYLTSGAVDKSLPLAATKADNSTAVDVTAVSRGTVLVLKGASFRPAEAADAAAATVPYICLVEADGVAAMAGSAGPSAVPTSSVGETSAFSGLTNIVGFGADGKAGTVPATIAGGSYVVTAIPLNMPGEFRTSEFTQTNPVIAVDDLLVVAAGGKLTKASGAIGAGQTIVGKVTKAATQTYHNYKKVSDTMQGGPVNVIEFTSLFAPASAT